MNMLAKVVQFIAGAVVLLLIITVGPLLTLLPTLIWAWLLAMLVGWLRS